MIAMLGSIMLTMITGVAVFLLTGSWLLTGATGLIGGLSYSRSLRVTK